MTHFKNHKRDMKGVKATIEHALAQQDREMEEFEKEEEEVHY